MLNFRSLSLVFVVFAVSSLARPSDAGLSCLDNNGNPVDWFIAIKVPDFIHTNPQDGKHYFFMTSKSQYWKLETNCDVEAHCGPIYDTFEQAFTLKAKNSSVEFIYNDELPEFAVSSSTYGHLKGAVTFDINTSGFWIIHSVPKFPDPEQYYFPYTGMRYGQHFFCVTFDHSKLATIARQLSIARPHTYDDYNLPEWLAVKIPDLHTIVTHKQPIVHAHNLTAYLTSADGMKLIHFSKSSKFGKDLYSGLVAPSLGVSLFMEGWVNGRGDIPSFCNGEYKVYNVKELTLNKNTWTTTHDHSKWAISTDQKQPWVCLGDINRQYSQFYRGGGTLCFMHDSVWDAFRKMIVNYEKCQDDEDEL